ncbi:hypothetical protein V1512DRAFT_267071 [Lipomyces arxii]|uniref:uncharacterized protein n=1 Tax=Lipomyces arxii TaxID=56418 RepID=UPI0034CF4487
MSPTSTLGTVAPYHLFSYSILFGSTVYQSFFVGITAFRALSRPQFSALQRKVFPPYFAMQTLIPGLLALTAPFPILENQLVLYTLAITSLTALVNLVYFGPWTVKIMTMRKAQETKEDKKYYEADVSADMKKLNKEFGMVHGISTIFNLGTLIASAVYGFILAGAITRGFA